MVTRSCWQVGGIIILWLTTACTSSNASTSDTGGSSGTGGAAAGASSTSDARPKGSSEGNDASRTGEDVGAGAGSTNDVPTAGASITGMVIGTSFNAASTALWIGMPDSPTTEVVYVFSNSVNCSALAAPVWDARIPMDTSVLEMKTLGTTTIAYPVASTANPATGQAVVNYTLSKTAVPSLETPSGGGTVTLSTIVPATNITGSFDLTFSNGDTLRGSFNAVYCPGGVEP
jgi:hypothetical protein